MNHKKIKNKIKIKLNKKNQKLSCNKLTTQLLINQLKTSQKTIQSQKEYKL